MGVTLSDVAGAIEAFSPVGLAEPWDRPGLQVGDPRAPVRTVFVALDPSPRAVSEAVRQRAQLLATHHPLFLHPLDRVDLSSPAGRVVSELLLSGVGLYSAHTNLDRAEGGVNDALARRLGLEEVRAFGQGEPQVKVVVGVSDLANPSPRRSAGRLGRLPKPRRAAEWAQDAARALGTDGARLSGPPETWLQDVAVCGGSGSSLWREAQREGAQGLVTGDVKYHTALEAAIEGFCLLDLGHATSERVAVEVMAAVFRRWAERAGTELDVRTFWEPDVFLPVGR